MRDGPNDLGELARLPSTDETWIAGSVPVHRWIVTKRGRTLRPDAVLVLSGESVVGVRILPEGPGPAGTLDLVARLMADPLTGEARRPARVLVGDAETAALLTASLAPLGVGAAEAEVRTVLTDRIRAVEAEAGGGFPLPGLLSIPGFEVADAERFFRSAASFHRKRPWTTIPDGEPVEIACDAWDHPTWYAAVLGSVGGPPGLALHPDWSALLEVYRGTDQEASPDALVLVYGDRTNVPFSDLDAIAEHDFDVDGNDGHPLVFRSRPGKEVARPSAAELEILQAALIGVESFLSTLPAGTEPTVVSAETFAGARRVRVRRAGSGPACP